MTSLARAFKGTGYGILSAFPALAAALPFRYQPRNTWEWVLMAVVMGFSFSGNILAAKWSNRNFGNIFIAFSVLNCITNYGHEFITQLYTFFLWQGALIQ